MRAATAVLLLLVLTSIQVQASHDWFGLDLCKADKERMPPELNPSVFPDRSSNGAMLLRSVCGQCHHAPGPGMHTAAEWPQVLGRMRTLMEVTARFGGLVREVREPAAEEEALVSAYLIEHALKPLPTYAASEVPADYLSLCGDCHEAPDPASRTPRDWPAALARMDDHRARMGRAPADFTSVARVRLFLTGDKASPIDAGEDRLQSVPEGDTGPWLALGPFFGLTLLGVLRWYVSYRRGV